MTTDLNFLLTLPTSVVVTLPTSIAVTLPIQSSKLLLIESLQNNNSQRDPFESLLDVRPLGYMYPRREFSLAKF